MRNEHRKDVCRERPIVQGQLYSASGSILFSTLAPHAKGRGGERKVHGTGTGVVHQRGGPVERARGAGSGGGLGGRG
jgi:hypothetical protein